MPKVTAKMCAELRRKAKQEKFVDINDEYPSIRERTIRYHANGKCSHEIDEKPREFTSRVTEEECKKMRKLFENKESCRKVAEELNRKAPTIIYHLKAKCNHDVSNDVTTDANNIGVKHSNITNRECRKIRKLYDEGHNVNAISNKVNKAEYTVRRHLYDECNHNVEYTTTAESNEVSKEECKNIRKIYRNSNNIRGTEQKTGRYRETIKFHVKGNCQHEVSEDISRDDIENRGYDRIDEKECSKIRRLYKNSFTWKQISDITERDRKTIGYHIKGKCSHEQSKNLIEIPNARKTPGKTNVSKEECNKIRKLFKRKNSAEEIQNELGRSQRTILKHVRANCRHDVSKSLFGQRYIVTVDECIEMRKMALDGKNSGEIAREFDYTSQTITSHIQNNCKHDTHGIHERIVVTPVDERMCSALRYLYYEECMPTDEIEEFDNIGISEEKIKRHVSGCCSHNLE